MVLPGIYGNAHGAKRITVLAHNDNIHREKLLAYALLLTTACLAERFFRLAAIGGCTATLRVKARL